VLAMADVYDTAYWYRIESFAGVDITGASDSTAGLQAAINAVPDGATILFPRACTLKLSSTITVTARTHLRLIGGPFVNTVVPGAAAGDAPNLLWNGAANGTMFDFESCFNPSISGFNFTSNVAINCFLNFDGTGINGVTGTAGNVQFCSTTNPTTNGNHVAVQISKTATNNQENYVVSWNSFTGFSAASRYSLLGVVNNGSANLACSDNPFSAGDVGRRVRVTYSVPAGHSATEGIIDTTIQTFTDSGHVVMAASSTFTQSNCTVHVGESFGKGIVVGNSQNSKHHKFDYNVPTNCAAAIEVPNGSFSVHHLNGEANDIGIKVGAGVVESCLIDFYESEADLVGISAAASVVPLAITNSRLDNNKQQGNGFLQLGGIVNITNCAGVAAVPTTNQVLAAMLSHVNISSSGNNFNISKGQAGFSIINGYPYGASGWITNNDQWDGNPEGSSERGPTNFNQLPSNPSPGMKWLIADSTTATVGAAIAGGGGNQVFAMRGTSNWIVVAPIP
jgi:hypothetical protein